MSNVPKFNIADATAADIPDVVACLVAAFANDPQARYFFPGDGELYRAAAPHFFGILAGARLELGMPVKVLRSGSRIGGMAMGYDTARPSWPAAFVARWNAFLDANDGVRQRLDRTDAICDQFQPEGRHFYLGVIGVHPDLQGKGAGAALVRDFIRHSNADAGSTGTYLETANPRNAELYRHLGFELTGTAELDHATRLWCMFCRKGFSASQPPI